MLLEHLSVHLIKIAKLRAHCCRRPWAGSAAVAAVLAWLFRVLPKGVRPSSPGTVAILRPKLVRRKGDGPSSPPSLATREPILIEQRGFARSPRRMQLWHDADIRL